MTRVLITGGAGFIGSHLARHFAAKGVEITILDDFSSGSQSNVIPQAKLITGSITDQAAVKSAIAGCDAVIHLAALVSVPACIENWQLGHEINLVGTINVFEAAANHGQIPVIYASSAAIYGDRGEALSQETSLPNPKSPYGADKLACEHQARAFWDAKKIPSIGLRFFNVYGPGQSISSPYAGVVARFCDNAKASIPHTIFGDGEQVRDFVFVGDLVNVIDQLLANLNQSPRADVLNVGTHVPTSLNDLVTAIDHIIPGSGKGVTYQEARIGDIRYSQGDDTQLRKVIGDIGWTTIDEGLAQIINERG